MARIKKLLIIFFFTCLSLITHSSEYPDESPSSTHAFTLQAPANMPFHYINQAAWSPDQKYIAAMFADNHRSNQQAEKAKKLFLWDTHSGQITKEHTADDIIQTICWSPSKQLIALGLLNGNIEILNVELERIYTLELNNAYGIVQHIDWHPQNEQLIAHYKNHLNSSNNLILWDVTTGNSDQISCKHNISSIKWSPCGNYIALIEKDGDLNVDTDSMEITYCGLKIIDVAHDRPYEDHVVLDAVFNQGIECFVWLLGTQRFSLLLTDGTFGVYDLSQKHLNTWQDSCLENFATTIACSPESKYLASGGRDGLKIWNLDTKLNEKRLVKRVKLQNAEDLVHQVMWAPYSPYICAIIQETWQKNKIMIFELSELYTSFRDRLYQEHTGRKRKAPSISKKQPGKNNTEKQS